jgi:peptidoglycan-N-acetylglucosamine deacetylase
MKFAVLALGIVGNLFAQSVAITIDDGPRTKTTPLMTPKARNEAMLKHLADAKVRAGLFVTSGNGANMPEGLELLKAWGAAGHLIGNHTVTHPDLNSAKVGLAAYQQELLDCDGVIKSIPGYRKFFRFTFLREGNTPEKRDGMRTFLKQQGYFNASVTLDTSDWRLDEQLVAALQRNPNADLAPFRRVYLDHLWQRAQAYRALSQKLLERDIPQVMLMHHNLLNALFLGDALDMFRSKGWSFVDPEKAYEDSIYSLQPERPAPGQSLLLSLARSKGWNLKQPEYQRLMDDADYEVELLGKAGL